MPSKAVRIRAGELLRTAADRIERCGLFQGDYWPTRAPDHLDDPYVEGDPCCAVGALALAEGIDDPGQVDYESATRPTLIVALDALLVRIGGTEDGYREIALWNDASGQTGQRVVTELRAAATALAAATSARRGAERTHTGAGLGEGGVSS